MQVDSASKEAQYLQGQLSDLNAVLSNHVAGTKLQMLQEQHGKLVASNHAERQRADAIYANRAAKQRQTKETQAAAEQIQKQLEQKVQEMSIEQQQEFYNLQVCHSCSIFELLPGCFCLLIAVHPQLCMAWVLPETHEHPRNNIKARF